MRKIIIVLVIVALAATAGAYIYLYQPFSRSQQTAMESVLPGDTLGMVRFCEMKKQIDRFKAGRMGQALAGLDLPRLMEVLSIPPAQRTVVLQEIENFKAAIESSWFDTLFGQDVSVAVLNVPIEIEMLESGDIQSVLDALVLVARPKAPVRVLESLNSMFSTQLAVQTDAYQQWEINQFVLENGHPVFYALADGLMVAGLSAAPVKRCLDQTLDQTSSLLQSQTYQRHCAGLYQPGQTDMVAYADADKVIATITEYVNSLLGIDPDMAALVKTKKQLESIRGLESLNFVQYDDGGPLVRSKMIVAIDENRLSPTLAAAMKTAPMTNPTLKNVPAKALMYSWQNTVDLKLVWEEVKQLPEMKPEVLEQIEQTVAMQTGMEMEALLAAFGSQFGLLINDINMGGMFPIPELALFIEVKQPELIDQLLKQQISQFNMPLQKETYRGADVQYLTIPMMANLSPSYILSDGFCTLSSSQTLLKGMLDAPDASLAGDPDFAALGQTMTAENNQVFYLDTAGMVAKTRDLINWAMSWMAMTKPEIIQQTQQVMELVVNPLLDGFSMVKAVGGRTFNEKTHISSDFHVLLDRT